MVGGRSDLQTSSLSSKVSDGGARTITSVCVVRREEAKGRSGVGVGVVVRTATKNVLLLSRVQRVCRQARS